MSSNELSFEKKLSAVQDRLISVIDSTVNSPIVRFLKPEERIIPEQELERRFSIYNGFVHITHYSKKSRKTNYNTYLGKHFQETLWFLDLSPEVTKSLVSFTRNATIALDNYVTNHYDGRIFLGMVRLDFLTENLESFFIPDFCLETNFFIYKNIADANASHKLFQPEYDPKRVPLEAYVNNEWEDILLEKSFGADLSAAHLQ